MMKRMGICLLCAGMVLSMAGCDKGGGSSSSGRIPNREEVSSTTSLPDDIVIGDSTTGGNSVSGGDDPGGNIEPDTSSGSEATSPMVLKNDFSSKTDSVLESQVGYSRYGYKAVYIRSTANPGDGRFYADFSLVNASNGKEAYKGRAVYWGAKWDSYWWTADFSDFQEDGEYILQIHGKNETLKSQKIQIGKQILTDASLQMVLFDQLDARRSAGKLGWRDSSTDELRELQANVIAIETLCDVYDTMFDRLSGVNQRKLIDNIQFGCTYLLALQEKTNDPMTNGRFKHDLYDTQYSAPKIRNFYDIVNAMAALARSYGIIKEFDSAAAETYKEAFELSYALCVLRPYYLESEFTLEVPEGRKGTTSAAKIRYGISSMLWEFPTTLRTRDRLMFMKACTAMYKSTGDGQYMAKAKELAAQVADRQYTDVANAPDGCFGMFKEFDNNETAFMLDWLQSFGQNLGNIQPTDLGPFIDLIAYEPASPDAARWHNVVATFTQGYVKRTAELTPLGIYPVGAYADAQNGGIKFFQSISHGANNLYGLMGRNMTILGSYLNDGSLQRLAQRNTQFIVGLNPGMPNAYKETKWTSYSFIYGLGTRNFKGFYGKGATYTPPLGSGINGFTAAPQFTERRIGEDPDLPKGILDENGNYQFNEDYLPHGMGYISAAVLTETPYTLTLKTRNGGAATNAKATVTVGEKTVGSYEVPASGELVLRDLPLGESVTVEVSKDGASIRRVFGTVGGGKSAWTVDFENLLQLRVTAPSTVTSEGGSVGVTLKNAGSKAMTVTVKLLADGVSLDRDTLTAELAPGQETTLSVKVSSGGSNRPYALLARAEHGGETTGVSVEGLAR